MNLGLGFAIAVMLGYGPQPWWRLFAGSMAPSAVPIEKLEDDLPERSVCDADSVVVHDTPPEDEENFEEDPEEDESLDKSARLQEIKADKLAKRLEAEKSRAPAQKTPSNPPRDASEPEEETETPPEDEIAEDPNLESTPDETSLQETMPDEETNEISYDAGESLDEIESLLAAAGQLEESHADSETDFNQAAEKTADSSAASTDEDRELSNDEIESLLGDK
ncbi:MAG: hypothetical protein ACIALR_08020 [Blastopirellula sp. JB062]